MINNKVIKLYNKNYNTDQLPVRKWDDPFYIPSVNRLLYDLSTGGKKETAFLDVRDDDDNEEEEEREEEDDDDEYLNLGRRRRSGMMENSSRRRRSSYIDDEPESQYLKPSDKYYTPDNLKELQLTSPEQTAITKYGILTTKTRALYEKQQPDDTYSNSANFYQNEVYEPPDKRQTLEGQFRDKEFSDPRHMVVYDPVKNDLFIVYRGSSSDNSKEAVYDWMSNFVSLGNYYNSYFTDKGNEQGALLNYIVKALSVESGLSSLTVSLDLLKQAGYTTSTANDIINKYGGLGMDDRVDVINNFINDDLPYHQDTLDRIISKYGLGVNVKFVGHSRGGGKAQMMMAYVKRKLDAKPRYKFKNVKAYVYNSVPYYVPEWQKTPDLDLYPIRTHSDIVSTITANHPNARQIYKDGKGHNIPSFNPLKMMGSLTRGHRATNFLNKDLSKVPTHNDKNASL